MSAINWKTAIEFEDITYKKCDGVARIAFNRPDVRNAFRPKTTAELYKAFYDAQDTSIGVVLLSGEGPSSKDGIWSFCSGGDQKARGHQGYVGEDGMHGLNILEVQRLIRFMPKVVIAVVPGWAVGGGHSLHVVCDLTLASKEHAIFKQTDADVTSFDGGYGSAYLAKMVGQKKAREIFFLGIALGRSDEVGRELGVGPEATVPSAVSGRAAVSLAVRSDVPRSVAEFEVMVTTGHRARIEDGHGGRQRSYRRADLYDPRQCGAGLDDGRSSR